MSRIDQALRRARARQIDHGFGEHASTTLTGESQLDQAALADYVPERRRAESDAPPENAPNPFGVKSDAPPENAPSLFGVKKVLHRELAKFDPALQGKLVISPDLNPISFEQYRRLGATLHALQAERGVKTLMVSSAVSQEGKTLTVTNLALTLSESYNRRVLLIDADLRRPSVHKMFGISNVTGLTDLIRRGVEQSPLVEVSPHLVVLPAGRLNAAAPMAELTSDRLPPLIKQLSTQFDWVLIDTPPTGVLPDARLVARVADAILFVIGAGVAPYEMVQRALAELGDQVIGAVLNRVDERNLGQSGYYGSYASHAPGD